VCYEIYENIEKLWRGRGVAYTWSNVMIKSSTRTDYENICQKRISPLQKYFIVFRSQTGTFPKKWMVKADCIQVVITYIYEYFW
jgi:hypothetical protein